MGNGERDGMGLTRKQRRLLGKCRRQVKPIRQMLRECRVGWATFAAWRAEPEFARAFRRVTGGMMQDTLADLRVAFAVCGRMISDEVFAVELGQRRKEAELAKKEAEGAGVTSGEKVGEKVKAPKKPKRPALTGVGYRLCFDVVKLGMGAFVPKTLPRKRRRAFPKLDPALFARLQKAQEGGGGDR
jgi:hypothetical protein